MNIYYEQWKRAELRISQRTKVNKRKYFGRSFLAGGKKMWKLRLQNVPAVYNFFAEITFCAGLWRGGGELSYLVCPGLVRT